jgi:tetratricopeptide (TPR) repeat protein
MVRSTGTVLLAAFILAAPGGGEPAPPSAPALIVAGRAEPTPRRGTPLSAAAAADRPETGADPREVFARANRLYEAGDYGTAAEGYEKLAKLGYRGGNLFYNLGNAYLKLDRKGPAILCYRKALRFLPRDQDLKSNLDYAVSLIEDRLGPAPRSPLLRRWDEAVGWFTLPEWLLAASAILWALCASRVAMIYAPPARPAFSRVSAALAALLLASSAAAFSRACVEGREEAVILAREARVRYGPSENDVVAFLLHEGATVEARNEKGDWRQVGLPDGKAGWVRKEECGLVR